MHVYQQDTSQKAFKEAIIVLIPKGERNTTNPGNYRPISLLENRRKILERIIKERLQRHLEGNNYSMRENLNSRKKEAARKSLP